MLCRKRRYTQKRANGGHKSPQTSFTRSREFSWISAARRGAVELRPLCFSLTLSSHAWFGQSSFSSRSQASQVRSRREVGRGPLTVPRSSPHQVTPLRLARAPCPPTLQAYDAHALSYLQPRCAERPAARTRCVALERARTPHPSPSSVYRQAHSGRDHVYRKLGRASLLGTLAFSTYVRGAPLTPHAAQRGAPH